MNPVRFRILALEAVDACEAGILFLAFTSNHAIHSILYSLFFIII